MKSIPQKRVANHALLEVRLPKSRVDEILPPVISCIFHQVSRDS
jgi:hypothetical protein